MGDHRKSTAMLIRQDKQKSPRKWTKELRTSINRKTALAEAMFQSGQTALGEKMLKHALCECGLDTYGNPQPSRDHQRKGEA